MNNYNRHCSCKRKAALAGSVNGCKNSVTRAMSPWPQHSPASGHARSSRRFPAGVGRCSIPFNLLKKFDMAPVHFSNDRRMLHMAFAEKIEYRALFAIEQMMDCKTEACLTTRAEIDAALLRMEEEQISRDKFFEGTSDPDETTRIICSYISSLNANEIRIAPCGELLWARITSDQLCENLLFSRTRGKVLEFTSKKLPEIISS